MANIIVNCGVCGCKTREDVVRTSKEEYEIHKKVKGDE